MDSIGAQDIQLVFSQMIVPTIIVILQWIKPPMPKRYRWTIPFIGFVVSIALTLTANNAFQWNYNPRMVVITGLFANVLASASYMSANSAQPQGKTETL